MKNIYLVRHTEYANPRRILAGRLPVEITASGKEHAVRLGEYFVDKNIDKIYSSAVKRCQQTSELISASPNSQNKISIKYDKRLLETFSAYQGLWFEEGKDLDWTHFFKHSDLLGGETFDDIRKRVASFFVEISKKSEGNIIVCSHGDPLFNLFLHLTDQPEPTNIHAVDIDDGYPPKGSIRLVQWEDEDNYEVEEIVEI